MRVAVISDVHANYHALEAVLNEIDAARVDAVWCLGDTVGYGPRPNECCDVVRDRAAYCLVGNHDLVVLGELTVSEFNDEAADRSHLDDRSPDTRVARVPCEPEALRRGRGRRSLPRERARPGLGVRADRRSGGGDARALVCPARPRRAQPRRSGDHGGRRPGRRRPRAAAARRSRWTAGDCSIRAPSGSRATAIPAPRGCCSISRRGLLSSAGSRIRLSARRPRCVSGVFHTRSRLGSSGASNRCSEGRPERDVLSWAPELG